MAPAPNDKRLLRKPRAPSKPQVPAVRDNDTIIVDGYSDIPQETLESYGSDVQFAAQNKELTAMSQERFVDGYRDNTYIAGASPPPPSEFSVSPFKEHELESIPPPPSRDNTRTVKKTVPCRSYTANSMEKRYMIDPVHRERTNLGTYVEGQSLLKPYRPRGPAPLPMRQPAVRQPQIIHYIAEDEEEIMRYYQQPEFTLQDFLIRVSEKEKVPIQKVEEIMYSRHNYKKLQNMLADLVIRPRKQKHIRTVDVTMPDELSKSSPRVPQKQLVLEMAALIKEQMSAVMNTEMRPVIKPLPKWSPDYKPGVARPHTEIVLYEGSPSKRSRDATEISIKIQPEYTQFSNNDALFHSATARYFQGSRRSNSPFTSEAVEGMISPSELAILDTLISGGSALSLKAHFISEMPDIEPLMKTITYLNLSFNDFRTVPYEVLEIENLTVLKLRNNPIREIPTEISKLRNLKTLVFSFCLVSTLPVGLFSLRKLEHLDMAYNRLSFIPSEVRQLKRLRELNVEGNQLPAMPVGLLKLQHLKHVRVRNNFMHPLFWKDNARNEPQSLTYMAILVLKQYQLENMCHGKVPKPLQDLIDSPSKCDCCGGPLYGSGLRMIRPIARIFGIRNLPFMFRSCSPDCFQKFHNSTADLIEMLYGNLSTG